MNRITPKLLSPGAALGLLALIVALAGTATAGHEVSISVNAKQAKKIATKVAKKQVKKLAPGLSVSKADTATTAGSAASAGNAAAVGGRQIRTISYRGGDTANSEVLSFKGLIIDLACAAGDERLTADFTESGGEISSISTDASNGTIANAHEDTTAPATAVSLTGGGSGSDRIYTVHYTRPAGGSVMVNLVTEDEVGTSICLVHGYAVG